MPSNESSPKILSLPAYTTILSQAFSPKGDYLAVGSERGRIAIFRISDLVSAGRDKSIEADKLTCLFYFDINTSSSPLKSTESVNTLSSTKDYLIGGISSLADNTSKILGWAWKDILKNTGDLLKGSRQTIKLSWSIDPTCQSSSGQPLLPTDINDLIVYDGNDRGRIFVAGGTCGPSHNLDHAIRVLDLEMRTELVRPLKGHEGYLHSISFCEQSQTLASASEDGTVKLWDLRQGSKQGLISEICPSKMGQLARPQLGRWIGAVSLSGELLACGGGPKAALFHLRTLTPIDPKGLHLPNTCENLGAFHVTKIVSDENRIILGGELEGKMYQTTLSGDLIAEIETSASCLYSVVHMNTESLKIMSCAGSSSKIDMCTANFSYKDRTILFPSAA